jgi:hypothetical protein
MGKTVTSLTGHHFVFAYSLISAGGPALRYTLPMTTTPNAFPSLARLRHHLVPATQRRLIIPGLTVVSVRQRPLGLLRPPVSPVTQHRPSLPRPQAPPPRRQRPPQSPRLVGVSVAA